MLKLPRMLKDSSMYLIGEIVSKGIPFLLLPYLTRQLGTENFGELSYYLVWLGLISVFMGLSQEGAVARYYYFYGNRSIGMIIKSGYIYSLLVSLTLLAIAIFLHSQVFIYLIFLSLFQVLISVQLSIRQCQRKPLSYIAIQIILSLSNVIFTYIFLHYMSAPDTLVDYRILAILISNIVTFFIIIVFMKGKFIVKFAMSKTKWLLGFSYIFTFGLPLIFHQLSFFVKGQVDRLFIYNQYSIAELGVYSAGVQLASILPILIMAINKAVVPHFYQSMKINYFDTFRQTKIYFWKSLLICFIPALIASALPTQFYVWFFGEGYQNSKYFIVFYLVGYGLNIPYLILVNCLFYDGKNKIIAYGSICSAVVYVILLTILSNISIYLIPLSLLMSNIALIVYLMLCVKIK